MSKSHKEIAKERIEVLFSEAKKEVKKGNKERSRSYIKLAKKISMKYNVSFSSEQNKKHCERCMVYWLPDKTCRTRIKSQRKYVLYTCLECGHEKRIPYTEEKKLK